MTDRAATPIDDGYCIGCGQLSSIGLKMVFATEGDLSVRASLTIPPTFQGWRGVVHGGIVALVLDEAMAYAAGARGFLGVTGDLKMRFRNEVGIGIPLEVRGNVLWHRRTVLGIEASVRDEAGTLLASAEGSFVVRGTLQPGERLGSRGVNGRT